MRSWELKGQKNLYMGGAYQRGDGVHSVLVTELS